MSHRRPRVGARPQVRDASQRNAYARGARTLWANLKTTAVEGAWVEVYTPHFERLLHHFDSPLADPVLQAGIDAQRHRLAYDQAAYSFGTCATFNKAMTKVREFKIGGSHGVSGDYYAGKIYNDFVRYVSKRQRRRPARTGARATRARSTRRATSSRRSAATRATRTSSPSPSRAEAPREPCSLTGWPHGASLSRAT